MKIYKHYTCFLALAILVTVAGYGQEIDCTDKLKEAQNAYDNGVLENVEELLTPCLNNDGFTKAEKTRAYKLLTMIGLFEDDFSMAEANMTNLLKNDPDFVPRTSDPYELEDLYNKFRTDPVFTVGIKAGLNIGYPTLLQYSTVGTSSDPDINWADSYSGLGFQGGLSYNHRIDKGLYVNFDPTVTVINHRMEERVGQDSVILVTKNESVTILSGQLGLSYDFRYRKPVKYYVEAGILGAYFLNASAKMEKAYLDNSGLAVQEAEVNLMGGTSSVSDEYQYNQNRTNGMLGYYYGFGVKYKLGNGHFLFGVRHVLGQSNVTQDRINQALYGNYDYMLKDITLNSIMFNIGYVHSIYMPKILKRYLKQD